MSQNGQTLKCVWSFWENYALKGYNFAKFTRKHLWQSLFLVKLLFLVNFIKDETLAQVFSSEFCEISKKTFL